MKKLYKLRTPSLYLPVVKQKINKTVKVWYIDMFGKFCNTSQYFPKETLFTVTSLQFYSQMTNTQMYNFHSVIRIRTLRPYFVHERFDK